ncbi:MAG: cytochrome c biogenesis protein ResB [Deltaproteobacteria bacterium]|nr:cytochrome c biogenesis protein ResB [Deltaproteobacteria bacterium]
MSNMVWKFFTSIKLTVVVLLTLAVTSIVGTLIPQNEDPAAYVQAYGEFAFSLFSTLGLFDMYHSWWFQSLIVLLTVNIVVCSIDRLSATRNILFVRKPAFDVSRFRKIKNKETFDDDRSPEQIRTLYASYVERAFRHSQMENTEKGFCIFGEKGRWTRFGVYTVHLSVILLLVGGLIGSIFGFDGFANIPEGETVTSVRLGNNGKTLPLPFELRCDDFNVSFYDSGMPKEYRSSLTILEDGQPVLTKEIIVNDPLRYKGISMFQSSYGPMPPNKASLNLTSKQTGMIYTKQVIVGEVIDLPENLGTFVLNSFDSAASFRGQNIGEALRGTLTPKQGNPVEVLLPLRFPSFDKMRRGNLIVSVAALEQRFYTGLQVTSDPGVWLVYMGFIIMIIGCYITFFMSHQQFCVEVVQKSNTCRVIVSGKANKNKLGVQAKVKRISEKLADLKPRPEKPEAKIRTGAEGAGHRA